MYLSKIYLALTTLLFCAAAFAQGPTRFDCPQYPSYDFFDRSCLIKTSYPNGEILLPQAGIDGYNEERPMHVSIPSNRPTWALGIAHAWNYNRNIIQRVDHPKISYWLAITAHETGMACDCDAEWPNGKKPWTSVVNAYEAKCQEAITQRDGCYQMEPANAWCGDLNQTWPWRFKPGDHENFISEGNFATSSIGLAYRNILNHFLIDYAWGVDIWPIIEQTNDPNAYEKLMASGWNSWAAAVQYNVSGTAGAQGFNLYTAAGRAAAIASDNWDLTATSTRYPEKIGWGMNVLDQNTSSSYYQYDNPVVTAVVGADQNHQFYGYYNEDITWGIVMDYLNEIFPFYSELTAAQQAEITQNVQIAFNKINGGAAVPFRQLGPVIDEIILGCPKEIPLMSVIHNDGLPAYNNGYRQCIGNYAPASHIENKSASDTICLGQSIILETVIDGGDGPNLVYNWFRDGIAIGNNNKELVVTPNSLGTFEYSVNVCNPDLGGCADACCIARIVVEDCDACGITATATTNNTPCQNMYDGSINLNISGTSDYTITYLSEDFGGILSGTTSNISINGLPDGVFDITIQDNNDPDCSYKLSAQVEFDTPMNEKLTAFVNTATDCDASLGTQLEQDDCECEWTVFFDTPNAAWERDVFVLITPSNGSTVRLRKDVLVNAYPAPESATFNLCSGESIKLELEVQPSSGSCDGNTAYNQQNAPIEVYIEDPSGTRVYHDIIPVGTAQQYQNYLAFDYTVQCPYSPGNYTYDWNSGGQTGSSVNVSGTDPTIYTVTATNVDNPQCTLSDTVLVPFDCDSCIKPSATISGIDTICEGDSTQIDVQLTGTAPWDIVINDGITQTKITNILTNTYSFFAYNQGTYTIDSVYDAACDTLGSGSVTIVFSEPIVDIGDSIAICGDTNLILNAGSNFQSYLWSDNSTDSTYQISNETMIWVEATNAFGCTSRDSLNITTSEISLDLGNDTTICSGDSLLLSSPTGMASYLWTGPETSINQNVTTSLSGRYVLNITDSAGCTATDSINIQFGRSTINLADINLCDGQSDTVSVGDEFVNVSWSTSANTSSIVVLNSSPSQISVELTDSVGCIIRDTFDISIYPLEMNLGADTILCFGTSSLLSPLNAYETYSWSGAKTSTDSVIVADISGDYELSVTDTNGCSASDTINVLIQDEIDIDFNSADTLFICAGDSVTILPQVTGGSAPYNYLWGNTAYGTDNNFSASNEGWHNVQVSDTNNCHTSDSIYLKINAGLVVNINDAQICQGDSVSIQTNYSGNNFSYLWNTGENNASITVTQPGIYGVVVDNGSGCMGSDSMTLSFHTAPEVDLGIDQNICEGDSVLLNAGDFDQYLWQDGSTNATNYARGGNFFVQVTDSNGCTANDSVLIQNIISPNPNEIIDQSICSSGSINLNVSGFDNGNGPFTYLWSNGSNNDGITLNNVQNNEMIWVIIADQYGCSGTDSAEIHIQPNLNVQIQSSGDTVFCAGNSTTLSTNYSNSGSAISWNDTLVAESILANTTGLYRATVDNGLGCTGSDSIFIDIKSIPDLSNVNTSVSFCDGDSALIGQNYGAGYSYNWSPLADTTPTIIINQSGNFSFEVTSPFGCKNDTNIAVNLYPIPDINLGPDQSVCEGDDVTLTSTSIQNATYSWFKIGNSSTIGTQNSLTVENSGEFFLIIADTNGCSASDSIEVEFLPKPTIELANGRDTAVLCENEQIHLDGLNKDVPNITYLWRPGGETTQSIQRDNPGWYSVVISNGLCSDEDSVFVEVIEIPLFVLNDDFLSINEYYCFAEDTVVISAAPMERNDLEYLWSTGETTESITIQEPGVYSVRLSKDRCYEEDSRSIDEYCETTLYLPNAFTPNGDGINDVFFAEGHNVEDFSLLIFNRWGELIYESQNLYDFWDGTYLGNEVQQDVYVWKVSYRYNQLGGVSIPKTRYGTVTLIRE